MWRDPYPGGGGSAPCICIDFRIIKRGRLFKMLMPQNKVTVSHDVFYYLFTSSALQLSVYSGINKKINKRCIDFRIIKRGGKGSSFQDANAARQGHRKP